MLFLPDTPRWYYAKGFDEQGDDALCRLYDAPLDAPAVQNVKQGILASIKLEESNEAKFSLLDLVWDRSDLRAGRRIRISFMILALQQMMGQSNSPFASLISVLTITRHQSFGLLQYCHILSSRTVSILSSAAGRDHEHSLRCRNHTSRLHHREGRAPKCHDVFCRRAHTLYGCICRDDRSAKPNSGNAMDSCSCHLCV